MSALWRPTTKEPPVKFQEIISREDQYEVAKARAEISWLGNILVRHPQTITNIFLNRLHKEENQAA